jgi:hypothetical protein
VVNKLHLKHNATDRLAICRIWPEDSFVLLAAVPYQSGGEVCQICMRIATATRLAQEISKYPLPEIGDLLKGSADILGFNGSPVHARAASIAPLRKSARPLIALIPTKAILPIIIKDLTCGFVSKE